jgi:hypothetical protein
VRLSDERLRWYHEDRFLPIDRVIGDDALAELRVAYDDVVDWRAEAPADQMLGGRIRVVRWPSATHAFFADNPARTELQEIADQVLGEAISTFDLLIGKPPGDPEITPWHQDMACATQPFAPAGTDVPPWNLRFWVVLDDTDLENGCMHFLPGYHRQPLLEHSVTAGDPDSANRLLALVELDRRSTSNGRWRCGCGQATPPCTATEPRTTRGRTDPPTGRGGPTSSTSPAAPRASAIVDASLPRIATGEPTTAWYTRPPGPIIANRTMAGVLDYADDSRR